MSKGGLSPKGNTMNDRARVQPTRTLDLECNRCDRNVETCLSWDHLITAVALRIRQALDLSDILQTTVDEVQRLLRCDRVFIYRFEPDWSGQVAVEATSASQWSVIERAIHDPCFEASWLEPYQENRYFAVEDVATARLTPCQAEFLAYWQVQANLVLPILKTDTLWGLLVVHHCQAPRPWQAVEIEGLQLLAVQVGIAIHQVSLIDQLQTAKTTLEAEVAARICDLEQANQALQEANQKLIEESRERQQAEAERLQAQTQLQQLAAIVASSQDAIISQTPDGLVTSWNRAAEDIFGYTATDMIGQPISTIIPPHLWDRAAQVLAQVHQGQRVETYETQRQQKNGQLVDVAITLSPIYDENGHIVGASKIARDISAHRREERLRQSAESALRDSQHQFEAFMRHAPAFTWITDTEGIIRYANPTWFDFVGQTAESALGQSLDALFPPEVAQEFRCNDQRVIETNTVVEIIESAPSHSGEEHTFLIRKFPIYQDQNVVAVGGIGIDITERQKAETALQDSEQRLQLALAQLQDHAATLRIFYETSPLLMGIVEISEDDILHRLCNPTTLEFFGVSSEALDNRWVSEIGVPPEHIELWLAHYRQSQSSQQPVQFTYEHITPNQCNWLSVIVSFVGMAESGRPQFSFIVQDTTERQQLEIERQRADAMQREADRVSHELNLLETILEIILAGYWDWDLTTNQEYLSPGFKRMFGYEDHELPNSPQTWQDLIFPEDLPSIFQQFERHVQSHGQIPFYNEVRYRHQDGSTVWVICSGQVIEWDDQGNPLRMIGCHIDITKRKLAEAALQKSEATNRAILIAIPDLLLRVGQDGTCYDCLPPSETHQDNLLPIRHHLSEVLPNELLTQQLQIIDQALQTGQLQTYEHQLEKQGRRCYEEVRIVPCGSDECLLIVRDITARIQMEQALRDSEATKQALINTIPDLLVRIRQDGVYIDVLNREGTNVQLFAYDKNQAGVHITEALPPALAQQRLAYVQQVVATQVPLTYEYQIEIEGNLYDEEARLIPLDNTSVLAVIRDISDRKRTESELKATKEQLELVLKASSEGFWDWNTITNEIYFSPCWKAMLGYEDHELDNSFEMWQSVIFEEDRIAALQLVEDYNSGKISEFKTVQRFRHKNGSTVFVLSRAIHLKDASGRVIRMVGSHLDITENTRQELALQASEARYRNIIETTLEGVWMLDAAGQTTFVNQRMADMLGCDVADMRGQSFLDFMPLEEQPQAQAYFARRHESIQEQHSFKFRRQDGADLWTLVSATPLFDLDGTYQGTIGLLTDITPLIDAQAALKESEMQLSGILNSALDGIMAFRSIRDDQGQIVDFEWLLSNSSACQIVQKLPSELIGHRLLDVLPGNRDDGLFDLYIQVVEMGEPIQRQFHYRHDGIDTWFENIAVRLGDGFAVTFRDISAIKQSEQALQQANSALELHLKDLRQRNDEMLMLSETSDFLQACRTIEEACSVILTLVEPLFPDCSGSFHITCASRNRVESVARWGDSLHSRDDFPPHDCWALRRGRWHSIPPSQPGLRCNHITATPSHLYTLCIPMIAQGETLGMFHLSTEKFDALNQAKQQLARTVAEQVGLAIANLNLRETLQSQSIRDGLTGLFNRRYLEESLQTEIARAQRHGYSTAIVMVDVDHFKSFNDQYGHDAGDVVLKAIAQVLKDGIRGSDIACRYGGEELTLVLPEIALSDAVAKAEEIRMAICAINMTYGGQLLSQLTASFGVALFPDHGTTGAEVIQAADVALYKAKAAGRNRVVIATEPAAADG